MIIALLLLVLVLVVIIREPNIVIALVIIGAIAAVLGGCDQYKTAQLPACTSHCTFTDGGREVTVSKPE